MTRGRSLRRLVSCSDSGVVSHWCGTCSFETNVAAPCCHCQDIKQLLRHQCTTSAITDVKAGFVSIVSVVI